MKNFILCLTSSLCLISCLGTSTTNLPKCSTIFLVSRGCIIQSNTCVDPVKSKEDFEKRCETDENVIFQNFR